MYVDEVNNLDDLLQCWKSSFDDIVMALIGGYSLFIGYDKNKAFMIRRWEARRAEIIKTRDYMEKFWTQNPVLIREYINVYGKELKRQRKIFTKYADPLFKSNFFDFAIVF